jgi:two-component sensor histidine kinase
VITVLRDASGQVRGFAKVTRDITERRAAEQALAQANEDLEHRVAERTAALQASLQEKEVLLKEIHHRVKNNLQVITSLLSLQHEAIDDPQALALFAESERRIGAMALVHETLYQTGDLGRFDLAQYIPTLSTQLLHAYGVEPQRVAVRLDLAEVTLPLDMAVPCGLILHELLSNALQHAFSDEQTGTITVTLTHEADRVTLRVQDNGRGLPTDFDVHHTASLGLQLVGALAEQLDGTMTLERTEGTAFTVTFPLPNSLGSGRPTRASG